MTLIEQIKADREAGTAGPWAKMHDHPNPDVAASLARIQPKVERVWNGNEIAMVFCCDHIEDGRQEQEYNARRIARVPDMEAALLAADELADAMGECVDKLESVIRGEFDGAWGEGEIENLLLPYVKTLAAYRKATGTEE